jgi:hypothetical protein
VVYLNEYPDRSSLDFLKQAGIEVTKMPGGRDELSEDIPEQVPEEEKQLSG